MTPVVTTTEIDAPLQVQVHCELSSVPLLETSTCFVADTPLTVTALTNPNAAELLRTQTSIAVTGPAPALKDANVVAELAGLSLVAEEANVTVAGAAVPPADSPGPGNETLCASAKGAANRKTVVKKDINFTGQLASST